MKISKNRQKQKLELMGDLDDRDLSLEVTQMVLPKQIYEDKKQENAKDKLDKMEIKIEQNSKW